MLYGVCLYVFLLGNTTLLLSIDKRGDVADSLTLDLVTISAQADLKVKNYNLLAVNPTQKDFQTLADLLIHQGFSVRSGGPGMLTTAGIRGVYGNQVALLWEGVNIQSPMNGFMDLSLIPAFFVDDASVELHNAAGAAGNASLAGNIRLQSEFTEDALKLFSEVGSFGKNVQGLDLATSIGPVGSRTRIFRNAATMDYPLPQNLHVFRERQQNAAFYVNAILQQWAYNQSATGLWELKAWFQKSDRQIIQNATILNPTANQQDQHTRIAASFKPHSNPGSIYRVAWITEQIDYTSNSLIEYENQVQSGVLDYSGSASPSEHTSLEWGVQSLYHLGRIDSYENEKGQQWLNSGYISVAHQRNRLKLFSSVRQQAENNHFLLPAPAVGASYLFSRRLEFAFHASSAYRIPTLNDRFWREVGNPELRTESSFKTDATLSYNHRAVYLSGSLYTNALRDMIVWLPNSQGVFSPQNVYRTSVQGAELWVSAQTQLHKHWVLQYHAQWALNRSVYAAALEHNEAVIGNQLMYIPFQTGAFWLTLKGRRLQCAAHIQYQGTMYTSPDHSQSLDPFYTLGFQSDYRWDWNGFSGTLGLRIHNATHQTYAYQPGIPMPGRNYNLNLIIQI